ncbi:MAG: hypothetical protein V3S08_05295 [Phycisphaerales bacterium]
MGVLGLIVTLLAAGAPTLVTRGVGHAIIRNVLERRVNGVVSLGEIELGWFGPQSVTGFEINSTDGTTAVQVDATLNVGLFDLALGRVDAIEVELSGNAHGVLRRDGSTSIDDLFSRPMRKKKLGAGNRRRQRIPDLAGVPTTTVVLAGLTVTLSEQGASRKTIRLADLTGVMQYTPGERVALDLAGAVGDGVTAGTITVAGHMDGLYDADGSVTPANATGRVEIQIRNLPVPLTDLPTELETLSLVATTDDPTDKVNVTVEAGATLDGTRSGRLVGALAIDSPLDDEGIVSLRLDQVTGRLIGESMPTALLQRFLRGTSLVATRDLGPLMDINAEFSTGTTRRVTVRARTDNVTFDFEGTVDESHRFRAERCRVEARLRPQLVHQLTGVRIERAAAVVVELDTLERDTELVARGHVRLREPVRVLDGPAAPLLRTVLDETLIVDIEATYGHGRLRAKLDVAGNGLVARSTVTLQDALLNVTGTVASMEVTPALFAAFQATNRPVVLVAPVRATLRLSPIEFAMKSSGGHPTATPIHARVGLSDARFKGIWGFGDIAIGGDFDVTLDGQTILIVADGVNVTLPRTTLQRRMGRAVTVAADLPMTLAVRSLRLPYAALGGKPFDGADVDIDVEFRGGPLVLDEPRIGRNAIRHIRVTLVGDDLGVGLAAQVTGDIDFAGARVPGRLRLDGTVTDLMTDDMLTASTATLMLSAQVNGLHTAVIDGLADMGGLLVAALGSHVDAVIEADNFSRNSGTLTTRIQATNGWLDGTVAGRNNSLQIKAVAPVHAELELTPPLRERLLYKIHPLLADIRTTEQPIRVTIGASSIPLDGDVSRLDARLEITVGKVEFDSGSEALALLTLAQATDARTIPGEIEPIRVTIRKGIVTYERFAVKIDKYTFIYTGTINLNTRYVDLKTEIPLDGLAGTFHELEGYTENISVPIRYRGRFGNVRAEVEPEFLAEAAAQLGLRYGIGELERQTGVPIGNILDGLFGKKKKR